MTSRFSIDELSPFGNASISAASAVRHESPVGAVTASIPSVPATAAAIASILP